MTDTYTMDDAPAAPQAGAPAAPVDPTPDDAEGKVSQDEANYRDGNLTYHCGLCKNFEGAANGTCTKVIGDISPYGLSDEYDGVQNPLLHLTPAANRPPKGGFKVAQRAPGAAANGPADEAAPPPVRIGRQVY